MERKTHQRGSEAARSVARVAPVEPFPVTFLHPVTGIFVDRLIHDVEDRAQKYPGKTIRLLLASSGGSFIPANAFLEFVMVQKISLDITVLGAAHSSALAILCAGERRRATSTTVFLLHENSREFHYRPSTRELGREYAFIKAEEDGFLQIMSGVTGQPESKLRKLMHAKTQLSAEEAMRLGFIHEVIPVKRS